MGSTQAEERAERVLVVAPFGRDAEVICQMLTGAGIDAEHVAGLSLATTLLSQGDPVGALLVTEEALANGAERELLDVLRGQPAWSDFPILVLTTPAGGARTRVTQLEDEANVTLIERPVRVRTLVRAAHAALRARRRQYQMREALVRERDARREVEAASRAKDEFLATVSHELRTPLNAILGWSGILRSGALPEDKRERAIVTIERNARVQTQLIEDLLDVSRIVSGTLRLATEPVDLGAVIDEAIEVVRPAVEAKGIELTSRSEGLRGGGILLGDSGRLQQIVWNLLSNAVKFARRGGHVDLLVRWEDADVEVVVRDDGEGITGEFLPHVFDRFRQADGTSTRAHGGLGLGLTIVRSLTELHGGTVDAASDGAGRGASFRVRLPLVALDGVRSARVGMDSERVPRMTAPLDALAGLRVLVVDDEQDAREVVTSILEHHGAEVTAVDCAAAAMKAILSSSFDVLVSDIGMAREDGYALIERVRALPDARRSRIPAIAMTAYARGVDRARALTAGFDEHAPKPLDACSLVTSVARLARTTSVNGAIRARA